MGTKKTSVLCAVTFCVATLVGATVTMAQPQPAPGLPRVAPIAAAKPPARKALSDRMAAELRTAGVTACAANLKRMIDFLAEKGDGGYRVQLIGENKAPSMILVTLETVHAAIPLSRYSLIGVVPAQGCMGFYEQTMHWTTACPTLKQQTFPNFPATGVIGRSIQYAAASASVNLTLIPAQQGCITVKKEVVL